MGGTNPYIEKPKVEKATRRFKITFVNLNETIEVDPDAPSCGTGIPGSVLDIAQRSQRYLGRMEEILVEDQNPKDQSQVMGRTRGNRLAFFEGDINQLRGKMVRVKIQEVRAFSLSGELVE